MLYNKLTILFCKESPHSHKTQITIHLTNTISLNPPYIFQKAVNTTKPIKATKPVPNKPAGADDSSSAALAGAGAGESSTTVSSSSVDGAGGASCFFFLGGDGDGASGDEEGGIEPSMSSMPGAIIAWLIWRTEMLYGFADTCFITIALRGASFTPEPNITSPENLESCCVISLV